MRHFAHFSDDVRSNLFHQVPCEITPNAPTETLGLALGATLYTPATRLDLAQAISKQARTGVTSMVLDLEDAIADDQVETGLLNLVSALRTLPSRLTEYERPLLFARVREPEQIVRIVDLLGDAVSMLSGFVLPKFDEVVGTAYLDEIDSASERSGHRLLAMPVLETPDVIHRESRLEVLISLKRLLDKHRERVVAVRIGATDLCGLYGLRRDRELTIYDLRFIGDAISDIVNVMGRAHDGGYLISAPVWEYFSNHERYFKPQLRSTPFEREDEATLRQQIVTKDLDGLIREVMLDKANGLNGKTAIHPSHVAAIHALSVVTHEEFSDACDILATGASGGVQRSNYRNKMNEVKPHRVWAERIARRAEVFGVAREDTSFVHLLAAAIR